MSGILELKELLNNIKPVLSDKEYVFSIHSTYSPGDISESGIFAAVKEKEGLTLIVEREYATRKNIPYDSVFRKITLQIHSSLNAVGLTAAVSSALADKGISANIIAAYYHDHVFVPSVKADEALLVLKSLSE